MDGFAGLVEDLLADIGIPRESIHHDYQATLPGWFRHEKEWDTAVVHDNKLLAAIEYKSQASSFGNNLNNRAEEAIGSNTDLFQAYEEGLFEPSPQPWVGYLFMMADVEESRDPVNLRETNFQADEAFQNASYIDRMETLLLRMVRQRLITHGAFLLSNEEEGLEGGFWQPNEELKFQDFARSLRAHVEGSVELNPEE